MYKNMMAFVALLAFILISAPITAKSKAVKSKDMTPLDLLNISALGSPALSPDANQLAFFRSDADWKENAHIVNIWLSHIDNGESRQLTFDTEEKSLLRWSPDGKYLSFITSRDDDLHRSLYLLPMDGGEAFSPIAHDARVINYQWHNNGRSIFFLADEPLSEKIKQRKKSKDDMFPFERSLSYRHIWKYDFETNTNTKITNGDFHVRGFTLARNADILVYSRVKERTIDEKHRGELWSLSSPWKKSQQLTDNSFAEDNIQLSSDGSKVLFISDVNEKGEYYYDANLFVLDIASKRLTLLGGEQNFEVESARWAADDKSIYVRANMGVRSELWEIATDDSRHRQLTDGKHTVRNWHYHPSSDQHIFQLVTPETPGELWVQKANESTARQITRIHDDFNKQFRLPRQELVQWKSHDGITLEGLLSFPLNYKKGRRYPLVVYSHGGPRSSDQYGQSRWRTYIPVLSSMGYAFFTPNYRGGRGYGDAFMRDMVGGYFNNAHLDVMSGVDHLIERGIADPNKLAKVGWSAGGHMTNKLITFTDRFKAASSGAGAVDWISMYGESDTRYGRTAWFGGTPWQENAPLDVFLENSPLKDMWKVTTPTLIFVGGRDIRVPPTQSIILYRALKDLGVETELYIAPREPHGFRELRHRLFKINAELEWFERHVRQRNYKWQDAPNSEDVQSKER